MKYNRVLIWFRNDLRLCDNATLTAAIAEGKEIIPVYCLDPRLFEMTTHGFPKTGNFRAKFILEAISDLKQNFKNLGSDLILLNGKPEEELLKFAKDNQAEAIFLSEEVTAEEKNVEDLLRKSALISGIAVNSNWQSTLYHLDDLPFSIQDLPEVFTFFRKDVEKKSTVRKILPATIELNFPKEMLGGNSKNLPTLKDLGLENPPVDLRGTLEWKGGETAAMERLEEYFWTKDLLKTYKETRNGLIGVDYSSKFSAWLALGCISPRVILEEVKRYEKERKKNDSTYWLIFELIWRDYFRFISRKHGSRIFKIGGLKNQIDLWKRDVANFELWKSGQTGIPFVDANMRELKSTGFMSNRGRQIVASFLVNDLGIDWTWGASYFESLLVDYDVCSNWGNWMYVAGVGNDPREDRYFNIFRQAKNYDKYGDYVRVWIPELNVIRDFDVHQPWNLSTGFLKSIGIELGKNYPYPLVDLSKKDGE
jgi:deoxyribodipyrimidine photo-lyase